MVAAVQRMMMGSWQAATDYMSPMGLGMCGPMLIGFGSPDQKAYYLPRILSGEDYWCQGYSEPGAGSDLTLADSGAWGGHSCMG